MAGRRMGSNAKKKRVTRNSRPSTKPNGAEVSPDRGNAPATRGPKETEDAVDAAAIHEPVPQTKLSSEELDTFKRRLLEKRQELVGDMGNMEAEALKKNRTDAAGDLSMMPIHMADIGTDNYEQEFTIGLIENEHEIVKEIDAALARLEKGTFGMCEGTHKPITKARLKAKPWARYCVAYKRLQEENGRRS